MEPIYNWDAEKKITTCTLTDNKGRSFVGVAKCHPTDDDFGNSYTGSHIACERSVIKYLKSVLRDELQPGLAALKQLYYSINKSKNYNPKSYESIMLRRQIRMKEDDIEFIKQELADREQRLKVYIAEKDMFYQKTRKSRAAKLPSDETN